ncbi:MAG: hypothetical protein KY451_03720 [Actinobacteria bacterium]|nr:hypothetical protein [Actinomycetota bacterium]
MGRAKAEQPRSATLLLRLTQPQRDVLDAAAHLRQITPNAYAYGLLTDHLALLAEQPHVKADLANRADYDSQQATTVPLKRTAEKAVKRTNAKKADIAGA